MKTSKHLQYIQQSFEFYYQNDDDKILDDLFLTLKNDLIALKCQNNPNSIAQILTHLVREIGCVYDLERCELMFDELINENVLNQDKLTPFWENLYLRQG